MVLELGYGVFGIIQVSEGDGLGRAGLGAGGDVFTLFELPPVFCVSLLLCPHQPVVAEGAFFDHAPHSGGDFWREVSGKALAFRKICIPPVEIPGTIGTGRLAISAAYTPRIYLADDTIIKIQFRRSRNANRNAWRVMVAVHARSGKITDLGMRELFAVGDPIKSHPGDGAFFIRLVRPYGNVVFGCTGHHARATTGTFVKIDDHTVFMFPAVIYFFHELPHHLSNWAKIVNF